MVEHGNETPRAAASEPYQVVARRFRPKAFTEVVGQEAIQSTLRAELTGGRVPHAFLFAGSRGVGKTTTARILARCLNCENGPTPEPCGECSLCKSILDGSNPDVIEVDAASHNGVDDVRALRDRVAFAAMRSRYKVYILDEAHMLSKGAWNALLKTLEEPPPGVVFVLATTELHKVPDTIRSRCQVLHFRRIGDTEIHSRLRMIADSEGVAIADDVLAEIAATSKGGMRDAETALERALQLARDHDGTFDLSAYRELTQRLGTDRVVEVAGALLSGNAAAGLRFCAEIQESGGDEREALGELVDALRSVLLLQVDGDDTGLVSHVGAVREQLQQLAKSAGRQQVEAMIQAAVLGRDRLRRLEDRAAILELTIVRMAEAGTLPSLGELIAAVRDGGIASASAVTAAGAKAFSAPRATGGVSKGPIPSSPAVAASDLRSVVLAASREEPLLHATLELCTFRGPDAAGKVVLALDTERKMHRDRVQSPQLQQKIVAWISRALGRTVTLAVELSVEGASPSSPGSVPPPGAGTLLVMEKFSGRRVSVDPEDRRMSEPPPPPSSDPVDDSPAAPPEIDPDA
ncbi:MAG: DNA polymerase III subunit gamma/tau [Planctomycetota bacterium]